MLDALPLGAAAGALNAPRRGRATVTQHEIERLAAHVTVRRVDAVVETDAGALSCCPASELRCSHASLSAAWLVL
jgi:hypothetical protein